MYPEEIDFSAPNAEELLLRLESFPREKFMSLSDKILDDINHLFK
jgi:hypothetical protein